ncbi:hypothetical protein V1264_015538 [Littorina saxatilis]|uniref:Uncharacterized protein n=1 Tax=Littorina saxatilis TaxID=31220 RepID=A0AAN9BMD2_9CAEN
MKSSIASPGHHSLENLGLFPLKCDNNDFENNSVVSQDCTFVSLLTPGTNVKDQFDKFHRKAARDKHRGKLGALFQDFDITEVIDIIVGYLYVHLPEVPVKYLPEITISQTHLKTSAFEPQGIVQAKARYIVGKGYLLEYIQQLCGAYCVSLEQQDPDSLQESVNKIKLLLVKASIVVNTVLLVASLLSFQSEDTPKHASDAALQDVIQKCRFALNETEHLKQDKYAKEGNPETKNKKFKQITNPTIVVRDKAGDEGKTKPVNACKEKTTKKQATKHVNPKQNKEHKDTEKNDNSALIEQHKDSEHEHSDSDASEPSVSFNLKDAAKPHFLFLDISEVCMKTAKLKPAGGTYRQPINNIDEKKMTSAADPRPQHDPRTSFSKGLQPIEPLDWLWAGFIPRDAGFRAPPRRIQQNAVVLTRDCVRQRMRQRNFRIASMVHLPRMDSVQMSEAGIYFDEDEDLFRCYVCSFRIPRHQWPAGEDPKELHRRKSPGCHVVNPDACKQRQTTAGQAIDKSKHDHHEAMKTDWQDAGDSTLFVVSDNYSTKSLETSTEP